MNSTLSGQYQKILSIPRCSTLRQREHFLSSLTPHSHWASTFKRSTHIKTVCLDFPSHDSQISKWTSSYLMYTQNSFSGTFFSITDWTKPGTALTSGEVNISALKQHHRPVSFPAYLSKVVIELSSKKFHCLPRQLQYLFHLPIIPSWHSWRPLLFLLPTTELGNMLGRGRGAHVGFLTFLQQLFTDKIHLQLLHVE